MFSSSSNFVPFQFPDYNNNNMIPSPFTHHRLQNPSPLLQEDHSSPFSHLFPSTFLDHGDSLLLTEFLSQQEQEEHHHHHDHQQGQQQQIFDCNTATSTAEAHDRKIVDSAAPKKATTRSKTMKKGGEVEPTKTPVRRRRTGKKDRHSKIHTAQGPRDRRMRLSLQIARKFFDLQDMLGFDKPSKTIEWLFTKSKAAIKELTDNLPGVNKQSSTNGVGNCASSTSESEVVSSTNLTQDHAEMLLVEGDHSVLMGIPSEKKRKTSGKPVSNPLARESRDKARARARERTKEKMQIKELDGPIKQYSSSSHPNPNTSQILLEGPSSPLENGEHLCPATTQQMKTSEKLVSEEDSSRLLQNQMDSVSIVDNSLGITSEARSSLIFLLPRDVEVLNTRADFEDHEFSGFPAGNWDMSNPRVQHRYCGAVPNTKHLSSTGNVHVQSPNAIFMTNPNIVHQERTNFDSTLNAAQDQTLASIFMTTSDSQEGNSSSSFFTSISNSNEKNPNSTPLTIRETSLQYFTENQFSYNPNIASKYESLF